MCKYLFRSEIKCECDNYFKNRIFYSRTHDKNTKIFEVFTTEFMLSIKFWRKKYFFIKLFLKKYLSYKNIKIGIGWLIRENWRKKLKITNEYFAYKCYQVEETRSNCFESKYYNKTLHHPKLGKHEYCRIAVMHCITNFLHWM